jgi:hypothetical protein
LLDDMCATLEAIARGEDTEIEIVYPEQPAAFGDDVARPADLDREGTTE